MLEQKIWHGGNYNHSCSNTEKQQHIGHNYYPTSRRWYDCRCIALNFQILTFLHAGISKRVPSKKKKKKVSPMKPLSVSIPSQIRPKISCVKRRKGEKKKQLCQTAFCIVCHEIDISLAVGGRGTVVPSVHMVVPNTWSPPIPLSCLVCNDKMSIRFSLTLFLIKFLSNALKMQRMLRADTANVVLKKMIRMCIHMSRYPRLFL